MNEEIIRETVQKEILNGIKKELYSTLIFTYIQSTEQENQQLKEVLDEIREKIEFAKTTIEYGGDHSDVGYNFLISADKIVEILDKVKE